MEISDIIHGDKFAALCDFGIVDGMEPRPVPKDENIRLVFCKQDRVDRFFNYIVAYEKQVVLITHNADTTIGADHLRALPPNVVRWFAQNVLINSSRITPIPIGLERPGVGGSSNYVAILQARKQRQAKKPSKKFLLSMNQVVYPELRMLLLDRLYGHPDVTIIYGLPFKTYLAALADHAFVISPPGNGFDCHRTWEALYVGATPVVWEPLGFYDYPMVHVRDTDALLEFIDRKPESPPFCEELAQLKFGYWQQLILGIRRVYANGC